MFIRNLRDLHFTTVVTSFSRSPKLGRNWFTLMPRLSFRRNKSHLFKNRISCVFASSFDSQIEVHRIIESSKRFTLWSSSRRWSKTDTGDTGGKNIHQMLIHLEIYWTHKKLSRSRCQNMEATPYAVECQLIVSSCKMLLMPTKVRQPPTSKICHSHPGCLSPTMSVRWIPLLQKGKGILVGWLSQGPVLNRSRYSWIPTVLRRARTISLSVTV